MTKITYREANGTDYVRDVADGLSVMRGALDGGVPHVKAECGGSAACATCQVRLDETWAAIVPPAEDLEISMLDEEDVAARVRLSCQITVTPELDGLIVLLPDV